jgi:hypothetical protein
VLWESRAFESSAEQYNLGFQRASGDLVVFVRGNEVFSPGVFRALADQAGENPSESAPLLVGSVEVEQSAEPLPDEERLFLPNSTRTWFDILKYWVFHSTPSFSGIFFRRSLLEEFCQRGADSSPLLFSEEFPHAPLYELSLRLSLHGVPLFSDLSEDDTSLILRLEQQPAVVRLYDGAATTREADQETELGQEYREASRIFHREGFAQTTAERKVSLVICASSGVTQELETTLQSCVHQSLADFEILVWDMEGTPERREELTRFVEGVAAISNDGAVPSCLAESIRIW